MMNVYFQSIISCFCIKFVFYNILQFWEKIDLLSFEMCEKPNL